MHAEEAEVVPCAQAGNDQSLLGLGRRRLLDYLGDFVQSSAPRHEMAADGAVIGKLAFVGGLDGGHGAILREGDFNELLGGALLAAANVEMVAYEEQEWRGADELARAEDGVPITERGDLLHKVEAPSLATGGRGVGGLIARANDDTDLGNADRKNLLYDDPQRSFGKAIPVHEGLERKRALAFAGGGDDCFLDFHGSEFLWPMLYGEPCRSAIGRQRNWGA